MSSKHHSVFIHPLFRAFCIVLFGITFIHSEQQHSEGSSSNTSADHHRVRGASLEHVSKVHNTQAAIDELNEVLRNIFPIVPHKSHFILTARNQKLWYKEPSKVLKSNLADQFITDSSSLPQKQPQQSNHINGNSNPFFRRGGDYGEEEVTETTSTGERTRGRPQQQHTVRSSPPIPEIFRPGSGGRSSTFDRSLLLTAGHQATPLSPQRELLGVYQHQQQPHQQLNHNQLSDDLLSVLEQEEMMPSLIGGSSSSSAGGQQLLPIIQQQQHHQQPHSSSSSSATDDNRPVAQGRLAPRPHPPPVASMPHYILRGSGKSRGGQPGGISRSEGTSQTVRIPVKPELTTPPLYKRGPECMRRCIMQGQLHPVQCHSLC